MKVLVVGNVCRDQVARAQRAIGQRSRRVDLENTSSGFGGAARVAEEVSRRGEQTVLLTAMSSSPEDNAQLEEWTALRGIDLLPAPAKVHRFPRRTRFVDESGLLHTIAEGALDRRSVPIDPLRPASSRPQEFSSVIVADYGGAASGWLTTDLLEGLTEVPFALAVFMRHRSSSAAWPGTRIAEVQVETRSSEDAIAAFDLTTHLEDLVSTQRCCTDYTVTTLGNDGLLFQKSEAEHLVWIPLDVRPVPDATGAGDALVAAFTAQAHRSQESLAMPEDVAAALAAAQASVAEAFAQGDASADPSVDEPVNETRIVLAGGCFDPPHSAHVAMLERASRLGTQLIVALNSDRSVARLKGPGRPVLKAADRAAVLNAMACVDDVVVFDEDTPRAVIEMIRPAVFVKGNDYVSQHYEAALLREIGGVAVAIRGDFERHSSHLLAGYLNAHGVDN